MLIYWNWEAIYAPALSVVVFFGSLSLQSSWVGQTAKKLGKYFAVDDNGLELDKDTRKKYTEYVLVRLSLDADRVQLAATMLTVPFSLVLLFDWQKEQLLIFLCICAVVITSTFKLLEHFDAEVNAGLSKHLSWISLATFIALVLYTFGIVMFTPPDVLVELSP